jgi:rhodanese-related sulfurtransferase
LQRGFHAAAAGAAAAVALGAWVAAAAAAEPADRFEPVRAYVQAWLAGAATEAALVSPLQLERRILDDWGEQQRHYQIVSVRKPEDDRQAGHVPHAINIYFPTLTEDSSLVRLDSTKTLVTCCYYGHASMLAYTILGLLGYRCASLDFGMMGWNRDALVKPPWDGEADYPVERTPTRPSATYDLPALPSESADPRGVLLERARAYLHSDASPVVSSADLKKILDDWEHERAHYQIVAAVSDSDYAYGHVPRALHVRWAEIAQLRHLRRLDPKKTTIVYSDNGQTGQSAATVLNLLGYPAVALKFGMMDWNLQCVPEARRWVGAAGYAVELGEGPPAQSGVPR